MEHQIELTKKSLLAQQKANLQQTLNLASNIIAGTVKLPHLEMKLTLQQALQKPTIRTVFSGDKGGVVGFSIVNLLVTRFIDSFAFSTKLNKTQIEMLTIDTLEHFSYESLEDIILFFKMARTGAFGSTKKGVDSNLIYGEWFPAYLEKKAQIRETNYTTEKSNRNNNNNNNNNNNKSTEKSTEK